jgi:hypothetical protein
MVAVGDASLRFGAGFRQRGKGHTILVYKAFSRGSDLFYSCTVVIELFFTVVIALGLGAWAQKALVTLKNVPKLIIGDDCRIISCSFSLLCTAFTDEEVAQPLPPRV